MGLKTRKIKYKVQDKVRGFKVQDRVKGFKIKFNSAPIFALVGVVSILGAVGFSIVYFNSNTSPKQQSRGTTIEKNKKSDNKFIFKLAPREDFLKKYNKSQISFLPNAGIASFSISGFIQNNSTDILLPARNWQVQFQDIDATSVMAVYMPEKRILYGRNIFETRPIASLTKLMTALVVLDEFDLEESVTITQTVIKEEGDTAGLIVGEKFSTEQLLYALLLESSNDAAAAFADNYAKKNTGVSFVDLMNKKAADMGLRNTFFVEVTGLDDRNVSNAYEVGQILYIAVQNPILAQVLSAPNYTTQSINKDFTHFWVNLNSLLGAYDGIIGGKTGFTNEAGPSMATAVKTPILLKDNLIISVVLDAPDREGATQQLLDWVKEAYIWE